VALLWSTLLLYVLGRLCQLYANRLPTLLIVILHVIPPAIFAIVHRSILYRLKGISIFAAFCLGFAGLAESISLRTGFPFGHHYFTDAMGPQVLHVPVLLVLAYLAIGYVFWVLAQLGSWAQTRARELDYLRLADAPPESCRDVPMGALDLSLTNPDLPTYAIDQFLGVVADPGLEHCLDVLDLFNAL